MKSSLRLAVLLAPLIFVAFVGCTTQPASPTKTNINSKSTAKGADAFRPFLEAVRYPENPRTSDDWTRYRDALQPLSQHFARPETIERMRLTPEEQKFLQAEANLTSDELAEVEAVTFRPADAHYLDECFLLRDAARSLEELGLNAIDQAHVHFRWVMRNVDLLDEGDV